MPTADQFRRALQSTFAQAQQNCHLDVTVVAGELHRGVGGYPDKDHRMPVCCGVMRSEMHVGDEIVSEPESGQGATLSINYKLPR